VIQDDIYDHAHASPTAAFDHLIELGLRSSLGGDPIADRLVVCPPLGAFDVFVGRRDLDVAVSVGPQEVLTLMGDVGVSPLEQLDGDLASEGRILVATFLGAGGEQLVRLEQ